ncbi:MAG: hypothetical protein RIF41_04820, partial [Polyangiaceae bacterium]
DPQDREECTAEARARRTDPSEWSAAERDALRAQLAHDEPAIVSALGCYVDVLPQCRVDGSYRGTLLDAEVLRLDLGGGPVHADELRGNCEGATHVVSAAAVDGHDVLSVELAPLSLEGTNLSGTWRGVMRQPGGPYEAYDVRLDIDHDGDRVTGESSLTTTDGAYWGRFRFEGRIDGNAIYFADSELLDEDIGFFLGWCMKGGYLLVDPTRDRLVGPWAAVMCMPGTLSLERDSRSTERVASGGT